MDGVVREVYERTQKIRLKPIERCQREQLLSQLTFAHDAAYS